MIILLAEPLERMCKWAVELYPREVIQGICGGLGIREDADPVAALVALSLSNNLTMETGLDQGDAEPDEAFCLRFWLTVLNEQSDA
jgi:hypothetical protein